MYMYNHVYTHSHILAGDLREIVEVFLSNSTPLGIAVFSIRNDSVTNGNSQFTVIAREAETDDIFGMPQFVQLPDFEVTVTIIEDDCEP